MIAINYNLIIIITYVIRKKLFQFFIPLPTYIQINDMWKPVEFWKKIYSLKGIFVE